MPSSHLILCRSLLLLPPIPPSIRVFSNESTLRMRWPNYWSFGFSIIPSKEIPGLISFRMDWLDLLAVQGTLKSLLQQESYWGLLHCRQILYQLSYHGSHKNNGCGTSLVRNNASRWGHPKEIMPQIKSVLASSLFSCPPAYSQT